MEEIKEKYPVKGFIMNGFFMYKQKEVKEKLLAGLDVHDYVDFQGMVMTDSGAFQGLKRPLYLDNKKIVAFQDQIGADIVSPLDLITPPGDNRTNAKGKMDATHKRIKQALPLVKNGILAGVQQGGKFLDLRRESMHALMEMQVKYVAIGSLVPFFNKNHNLEFVSKVIAEARSICGELPMHVYGAGDPLELPFLAAAGANIFDSSSYGHYAAGGWYMTPYGSLTGPELLQSTDWKCNCHVCRENEPEQVFSSQGLLAAHNLASIFETLETIRMQQEANSLENHLADLITKHMTWFPESDLQQSWEAWYG